LAVSEVKAEWQAQIDRFVAIMGRAPDHLDSHHHMSFLNSGFFRVMLELADHYGCAIRFPTGAAADDMLGDFAADKKREILESAQRLVNEHQPRRPDYFIKTFYDVNATLPHLLDVLAALPDGTTEIMCHPGYADEALMQMSIYNQQREAEIAILTDPEVLEAVSERGINLCNFGDL
jgi:predicted glycoside hydrolase/deacetylase ChbG (UPF0249 family)